MLSLRPRHALYSIAGLGKASSGARLGGLRDQPRLTGRSRMEDTVEQSDKGWIKVNSLGRDFVVFTCDSAGITTLRLFMVLPNR